MDTRMVAQHLSDAGTKVLDEMIEFGKGTNGFATAHTDQAFLFEEIARLRKRLDALCAQAEKRTIPAAPENHLPHGNQEIFLADCLSDNAPISREILEKWFTEIPIEDIKRDIVVHRMRFYGRKSVVARSLNIAQHTLYNWLEKWGLLGQFREEHPSRSPYK